MVPMRTTGDDPTTESRPLGESDTSQSSETSGPVGTETGSAGADDGSFGSETGNEPVGTDTGAAGPEDGGFGTGSEAEPVSTDTDTDTGSMEDMISGLSEEEADEMAADIFEGAYGEDGEAILADLQESLGLDSHQILEILVGEPGGGGAYGDGGDGTVASEPTPDSTAAQSVDGMDADGGAGDTFMGTGMGLGGSMSVGYEDADLPDDSGADFESAETFSVDDAGVDDFEVPDDAIDIG